MNLYMDIGLAATYKSNSITYNKLRKLISKKLDIETTIAYN